MDRSSTFENQPFFVFANLECKRPVEAFGAWYFLRFPRLTRRLIHHTIIGNGGLDANWLTAHGFPTVTMGCGQHNIHAVDETLDLDENLKACEVVLKLATAA